MANTKKTAEKANKDINPEITEEIEVTETVAKATTVKAAKPKKKTAKAKVPAEEVKSEKAAKEKSITPKMAAKLRDEKIIEEAQANIEAVYPGSPKKKTSKLISVASTTLQTPEEKQMSDIIDLIESLKSKKILVGTIAGIETINNRRVAVVFYGENKVLIPGEYLIPADSDTQKQPGFDNFIDAMTIKRGGAEIDYVIEKFDRNANVAIGNRVAAMKMRQQYFFLNPDRQGNMRVYPGAICAARVVSVIAPGVYVEILGVETFIHLSELSYNRISNAKTEFVPGQSVIVKILNIDTTNKNDIKVTASVKQAQENPAAKAISKFTIDGHYMGTVSFIATNGIFVTLDGGIDCLCQFPHYERPLTGSRVTVCIKGINKEECKIWGNITYTAGII